LVCVLLYASAGCSEYQLGKGVGLAGTHGTGDTALGRLDTAGDSTPAAEPAFGWYILEDATQYPITSEGTDVISVGDPDGFWYEPSGAHGLIRSTDPDRDFAVLADYILDRTVGPIAVTGPIDLRTRSSIEPLEELSFAFLLCRFWVAPEDDPALYSIESGHPDDALRIILNGDVIADLGYGDSGRWGATALVPGATNTLVGLVMDGARDLRYVEGFALYRDGVMVTE
jgi:hypothetical protein